MAKTFWQKINLKFILFFSLLLRLVLCPWIYHGDITATYWWGKFASDFGWRGYYNWLEFGGYIHPDQPMLNIIYDWLIRLLYNFIYQILWFINIKIPAFPSALMQWYFINGNQILLKVPMIVADVIIIYFVYRFLKKNFSASKAKLGAIILSLYPPMIYNSAIWGSGDSLINLFALLAFYCLYQRKYYPFVLFLMTSLLYKVSLIIWLPLVCILLIKNKPSIRQCLIMFFESTIYIFLFAHPFAIKNTFVWFYEIMAGKILPGVMPQITANAMNFWALIFGLQPRLDEFLLLNLVSIRTLSLIICALLYIYVIFRSYRHLTPKNILLLMVQLTLITFTFMTRMHERYTYPALIPLFLLCFYDSKYWKYFWILSLTHLLNVYNWWWVPPIAPLINLLKFDPFVRFISLVNLVLTLLLLKPYEDRR